MPKSTKTSSKSQKDTKPHIAILATGGTIAGLADLSTKECRANHSDEYSAGVLSIDEILDSLAKNGYKKHKKTKKSLQNLARISTKQIANIDSVDMSDEVWLTLAREIEAVFSGKVDGIVITHGTDTLEESAYFLHLVAKTQKPIVLVGAMRPANVPNSDGSKNLYNAIALAAHKDAKGVMIAMAGQILSPRYASKAHTHKLNAFCAPSVIGSVRNGKVKFAKSLNLSTPPNLAKKSTNLSKSKKISKAFLQPFLQNPAPFCVRDCLALPKVDILYSYSNDGSAVAAKAFFASGAQGLVIAGSGAGSIHQSHKNALKELILQGVVVVVSSRINGGCVVLKEADKNSGFVSAGELNPQKARVLLMLCLTRTRDKAKIQEYFETY